MDTNLKNWSESPRTLPEEMAWTAVSDGAAEGRGIDWNGATKEPFLSLEAEGWLKLEHVTRLTDTKITIHFWQSPTGDRRHLKVKTT